MRTVNVNKHHFVQELVLASSSPRRHELLTKLGIQFRVRAANIDESSCESNPEKLVTQLALQKAQAVAALEPKSTILAADTTVSLHDMILNKPQDINENAQFIAQLSGNWHEVFTGISFIAPHGQIVGVAQTRVKFRTLSVPEIKGYAQSGEGLDKAGGYSIQDRGMSLIERIEGDYFNIVGLPVSYMLVLAREFGLELLPWALGTT